MTRIIALQPQGHKQILRVQRKNSRVNRTIGTGAPPVLRHRAPGSPPGAVYSASFSPTGRPHRRQRTRPRSGISSTAIERISEPTGARTTALHPRSDAKAFRTIENSEGGLERAMRIELTTYSLGSCRSTTELRPQGPSVIPDNKTNDKSDSASWIKFPLGADANHASAVFSSKDFRRRDRVVQTALFWRASRSRISVSSLTSAGGSGSGFASSAFFSELMPLTARNMMKAMMMKLTATVRNLP